ncbi:MAG: nickel-binding protein [Hyphomonas sp.]
MNLYVIRRPSAWATDAELEVVAARSARIGNEDMPNDLRWIRSYVVTEADGRLGTFCIYEAVSDAVIRDHAARVGMPGDDIFPVRATVIVRPDPAEVATAA